MNNQFETAKQLTAKILCAYAFYNTINLFFNSSDFDFKNITYAIIITSLLIIVYFRKLVINKEKFASKKIIHRIIGIIILTFFVQNISKIYSSFLPITTINYSYEYENINYDGDYVQKSEIYPIISYKRDECTLKKEKIYTSDNSYRIQDCLNCNSIAQRKIDEYFKYDEDYKSTAYNCGLVLKYYIFIETTILDGYKPLNYNNVNNIVIFIFSQLELLIYISISTLIIICFKMFRDIKSAKPQI